MTWRSHKPSVEGAALEGDFIQGWEASGSQLPARREQSVQTATPSLWLFVSHWVYLSHSEHHAGEMLAGEMLPHHSKRVLLIKLQSDSSPVTLFRAL